MRAQLRVELVDVRPHIWRRVLVPQSVTLAKLHAILQRTMGWTDSHLHLFEIAGQRFGVPDPDWDLDDRVIDERRVRLQTLLEGGARTFVYRYDFGDDWEHAVSVEDIVAPDDPELPPVVCTAGENACPPEDVGGAPGYERFLEALADPAHEEHVQMRLWSGCPFDPAAFDRNATNRLLARVKL
jgi:Plasmid pRiA4b ORF-3-like protein